MKNLTLAVAAVLVLVGCDTDSSTPTGVTPPTEMESPTVAPQAPAPLNEDPDIEFSDADFTALALPAVNAERLEAGAMQAIGCTVIASFRGKSIYVEADKSVGMVAKKGKGSVSDSHAKGRGDLVLVWFPVNLKTNKLKRATLAAGICT